MQTSTDTKQKPTGSFLQRAVRNFLFSGLGTVSNFALGFLFAGLTIRYLGEARAGFFMALSALMGLNAILWDFGLGTPAIRRVAALNAEGDLATARRVIGTVCTASLASSLIIVIPAMLFFSRIFSWSRLSPEFRADAFWATILTLSGFVLSQAANPWRATYTALERYGLTSFFNSLFGLLSGLGGIAILVSFPTMTALAGVRLGISLARFLVDAVFMRRLLAGPVWPAWAWGEVQSMAAFGGWVYLESIGGLLLGRVNSLVLTTFLGSAALPYYELPQRFYNQVYAALDNQTQILFPMLASYGEKAADQFRRLEDRMAWFIAVASAAIYTGIAVAGPALLGRLVGPAFAAKVEIPLYLACIQGFFQAQHLVPYYASYAMGLGKPNSIIQLVQGVCVAVTAILLIPHYGLLGVCVAQLWVIVTVIAHIIWVRRLIAPELPTFGWLKIFISPIIMVLAWLAVSRWVQNALVPGIQGACLAVCAGGLAGLCCVLAIEAGICKENQRWTTLSRIIELPLRKLARRFS